MEPTPNYTHQRWGIGGGGEAGLVTVSNLTRLPVAEKESLRNALFFSPLRMIKADVVQT